LEGGAPASLCRHFGAVAEGWNNGSPSIIYAPIAACPSDDSNYCAKRLANAYFVVGAFRDLAGSAVHQQGIVLKQNNQRAFIPETEPRTPVAERLCVHARSGVKHSTHAAADIPIPCTGTRPRGSIPAARHRRFSRASVPLLSPRDTKGARAAAITHVYRFPPLGECRHLFDKRIGHKLDGIRPVVGCSTSTGGRRNPSPTGEAAEGRCLSGVGQTALPRRLISPVISEDCPPHPTCLPLLGNSRLSRYAKTVTNMPSCRLTGASIPDAFLTIAIA
jgi:hypothetical protein